MLKLCLRGVAKVGELCMRKCFTGMTMKLSIAALLFVFVAAPRCMAGTNANAGEVELSQQGRASIEQALQYLANNQRADGSFAGELGRTTGIVAAGTLAWMVNGNLPGEGPYGKNVAKGIDFILTYAQPTGLLCKKGEDDGHVMYHHALAELCLAEAWGQTRDKRIGEKLKAAVELQVRAQNRYGGWHYQPAMQSFDLSVVVMQLVALRAAKDAGIAVPKETIERAIACVETCRSKKDAEGLSGFSYSGGGEKSWPMTAAGLMCLQVCGNYKPAALKDGLDYLMKNRERKGDSQGLKPYGHYYAMQAMYQAGGAGGVFLDYWKKWYPDVSKEVIAAQVKSGANRGSFGGGFAGYGVWSTGMCVLMLGIPYRYLPIYQR